MGDELLQFLRMGMNFNLQPQQQQPPPPQPQPALTSQQSAFTPQQAALLAQLVQNGPMIQGSPIQSLLRLLQQPQQSQPQQPLSQPPPTATANVTATTAIVSPSCVTTSNIDTVKSRSPKHSTTTTSGGRGGNKSRAKSTVTKQTAASPAAAGAQMSPALTALKLNLDAAANAESQQPLSSLTSLDEGVLTSWTSPAETASGAASPTTADDEHALPREHEAATRKRPSEIQNLLLKKKRLDAISDILQKKSITDGVDEEAPLSAADASKWESVLSTFCVKREDDAETTSSDGSNGSGAGRASKSAAVKLDDAATLDDSALGDKSLDPTAQADNIPSDWKTTNNEVYESPDAWRIPHDQIFAKVPGRLSLLSNVTRHNVSRESQSSIKKQSSLQMTVGEVRRRLLGCESFNFSLLGALLRRAKMPEKSKALLDELRKIGLAIPRGRRRAEKVTLLSALTEHEAEQLFVDFGAVSDAHFPTKEFAHLSLEQIVERAQLQQRVADLKSTRTMIDDYTRWLEMDRSEIRDKKPTPILAPELQDPLSNYSMITHGFGTPGLLVGVKTFRKFVEDQLATISSQLDEI